MYHLLHETLEKWARGLLAALLNVPDPGFMPGTAIGAGTEFLDAPYPWASLGVAVAAAVAAGVILAPLDLIRTKYICSVPSFFCTPD
jgi:fusion and transport protein UGO1